MISKRMRELLLHIDACPLDGVGTKVLKRKNATEADVAQWLQVLLGLKDDIKSMAVLDIRNRSILVHTDFIGGGEEEVGP